jgi:putative peptidoglycan lipid II flippase
MSRRPSIARAAGSVAIATALSRVLGVAREMTISHRFPTFATDAFIAAFRIPNLLRDLLAEGALSAAFIPVFSELAERRSWRDAYRLASSVLNALAIVTGLVALSIVLFARWYALSVASGFPPDQLALTAWLGRLMAPFVVTVALAATLMGMANVRGRYFVPALAPALFNVGVLTGGWLLAPWLERNGWPGVTGLAVGAVLGGGLQLVAQFAALRGSGFRHAWLVDWREPALRQVLARLAPAALGVAATYLNVLVDTQVASHYGPGPVSYLFFAIRLWMLPIGLFGVAISTANLAGVARDAARGDRGAFRATLATSVRLTLLLTVPSAVGLVLLARPIVRVVYQHGLFGPEDAAATAWLLALYAVGLPGYALVKVFVPTLYAMGRAWSPVIAAIGVIALKIVLFFGVLGPAMGYAGLALATGIAALANAAWTGRLLVRHAGRLAGLAVTRAAVTGCGASAAMAIVVWATGAGLRALWPSAAWWPSALRLAPQIAVGIAVVGIIVALSGLPEGRRVAGWLGRRGREPKG